MVQRPGVGVRAFHALLLRGAALRLAGPGGTAFDACPSAPKRLGGGAMTGANKEMPVALDDAGDIDMTLRAVLVDVLGLDATRVAGFTEVTPLLDRKSTRLNSSH